MNRFKKKKRVKSSLLVKTSWSSQKLTRYRTVVTKVWPLQQHITVFWDGDEKICREGPAIQALTSPLGRRTTDAGVNTNGECKHLHLFTYSEKYYRFHLWWARSSSRKWRLEQWKRWTQNLPSSGMGCTFWCGRQTRNKQGNMKWW